MRGDIVDRSYLERFSSRLLKSLRGCLSQKELSTEMGYSFNQVGKWEALVKKIYISDFLKFCNACDVNFSEVIKQVLKYELNPLDIGEFLKVTLNFNYLNRENELAERLNISQSRLSEYLNNEGEIDLVTFFHFLKLTTERLDDIYAYTVKEENKNLFYSKNMIDLYRKHPKSVFIYCAINTGRFLSSDSPIEALSEMTGLTQEESALYLDELLIRDLIYIDNGYKSRIFKININDDDESDVGYLFLRMVMQNMQESISDKERLKTVFRFAPVSKKVENEIKDIIRETYGRINSLIEDENDEDKSEIVSIHLGLLNYKK